jgi:protein gp37
MEPRHGVQQDQPRLQALLRRAHGGAPSGDGAGELQERLRAHAQCARADVAFFFKQWGGKNKKKAGRLLDGRTWDEMPTSPESTPGSRSSRSLPVMA